MLLSFALYFRFFVSLCRVGFYMLVAASAILYLHTHTHIHMRECPVCLSDCPPVPLSVVVSPQRFKQLPKMFHLMWLICCCCRCLWPS